MLHSVCQGLDQCHFHFAFLAYCASQGLDDAHHVVNKRRNCFDPSFQCFLQFEDQIFAFEFTRWKGICHLGPIAFCHSLQLFREAFNITGLLVNLNGKNVGRVKLFYLCF
jgi:hypothetical protein